MRFAVRWSGMTVGLEWDPEPGDSLVAGHARLVGRSARVMLPVAVGPDDVHPDVEALLAALILAPFCRSMTFQRGVSASFAEAVRTHLDRIVGPVDPGLEPRRAPADGRMGLAFSGGTDSSAALAVLPEDTVACFMDRIDFPGTDVRSRYSASAPLYSCSELASRGRPILVARSDLVHVRHPVGFTTDWVNAAPLLLMAEVQRLESVSWGTIAEAAYGLGRARYVDWAARQAGFWGGTFAAAGLPMALAVAGISKVGAAMIVRHWEHGDLAQSCPYGAPGKPCRSCWKCFLGHLVEARLVGEEPDPVEVDHLLRSKHARKMLAYSPFKQENVVAWALQSYRGAHPVLRQVQERTQADGQDLGWLQRFYGPSLDLLVEPRRSSVRARLAGFLDPMTTEDMDSMRSRDLGPLLAQPATQVAHDNLGLMLAEYDRPARRRRQPLRRRLRRAIREGLRR
jgi:hypothetical protein